MATEATRSGRPTVPALLVLLLALIAGLSAPPVVTGPAVPGQPAVSRSVGAAAEAAVPASNEPPAAPVEATEFVAGDRESVLRPQAVDAVRTPRAPPAVTA